MPLSAAVLNVPSEFPTIQVAIAVADSGDEVVVAPGTYVEKLDMLGRDITLRSSGGPAVTILDVSTLLPPDEDPGAVITCRSGEGPDTIIEGFTITGGTGDTSLFLEIGGGVFLDSTSPTIVNCVVTGNTAVLGGGLYAFFGASPSIVGCVFEGNTASVSGGGLGAQSGSAIEIVDCRFTSNTSLGDAGALFFSDSLPIVVNCTMDGNTAETVGGAICNRDSELPLFVNCTIYDNQAMLSGGAVYDAEATFPSSSTLVNCIAWANSSPQLSGTTDAPSATYSDIESGFAGAGNISADPLFIDAAGGDYRLSPGSPCIDAGNNAEVPGGIDTDVDGNPRFLDDPDTPDCQQAPGTCGDAPVVDMGAHEFQGGTTCVGDTNLDGLVDVDDINNVILDWGTDGSAHGGDVTGSAPGRPPDGVVDSSDLIAVFVAWGGCPQESDF